jgi:S-adenosylmethionine uptake transporter
LQPFDFLRLPTVALVGWFVFRESTDMWTWIGAALIAAAAIYTANREARLRQT